jgi:hypothetical protein
MVVLHSVLYPLTTICQYQVQKSLCVEESNKCDMRASATQEPSILCSGRVIFCLFCRQKGQYGRRSG